MRTLNRNVIHFFLFSENNLGNLFSFLDIHGILFFCVTESDYRDNLCKRLTNRNFLFLGHIHHNMFPLLSQYCTINTEVNEKQKRKTIQYPYPVAAKGRGLRGICLGRHPGGWQNWVWKYSILLGFLSKEIREPFLYC